MISKRIIIPLLIVILLSGIAGVIAAKKYTEAQLKKTQEATKLVEPTKEEVDQQTEEALPQ